MSNLSASPVNFHRFLELQRSASRSLSPEKEIRQMTIQTVTLSGFADAHRVGAAGLPTALHAAGPGKGGGETGSGGLAEEGSCTSAAVGGRSLLAEASAVAACWQFGSPLYYPVTDSMYCWNAHPTTPTPCTAYTDVEGVSCDFCGLTVWISGAAAAVSVASVAGSPATPTFHHCTTCGMDLCEACAQDIRRDERLHLPCLWCDVCRTYISLDADHACRPHPLVLEQVRRPTAISPGGAATGDDMEPVGGHTPSLRRSMELTALHDSTDSSGASPNAAGPAAAAEAEAVAAVAERPLPLPSPSVLPQAPPLVEAPVKPKRSHKSKAEQARRAERARIRLEKRLAKERAKQEARKRRRIRQAAATVSVATVAAPPPEGWQVRVVVGDKDRAEIRRMARELTLDIYEDSPDDAGNAVVVFVLPTRLRAEKCARRAHEAGLSTTLQRV